MNKPKSIDVINSAEADVEYFKQKVINASIDQDPLVAEKARKRLELLKDSVVVYKVNKGA